MAEVTLHISSDGTMMDVNGTPLDLVETVITAVTKEELTEHVAKQVLSNLNEEALDYVLDAIEKNPSPEHIEKQAEQIKNLLKGAKDYDEQLSDN